jgi:hypothetical protein
VLIAPPDLAARLAAVLEFGAPGMPLRIAGSAEEYPTDRLARNVRAAAVWWAAVLGMTGRTASDFESRLVAAIEAEMAEQDTTRSGISLSNELADKLIGRVAADMGLASEVCVPVGAATHITSGGVLAAACEADQLSDFVRTPAPVAVRRTSSPAASMELGRPS